MAQAGQADAQEWWRWTGDDAIRALTMVVIFGGLWLIFLIAKLGLGMALLSFSRQRYRAVVAREHEVDKTNGPGAWDKVKERESFDTGGRRIGGWGTVEVDDEKRKLIYDSDAEGLRRVRERERAFERAGKGGSGKDGEDFERVRRYDMVAKRIW